MLGNVYKKQGRLDEARAEFENFIRIQNKISPGGRGRLLSAPVHSELADVYDKLGVGFATAVVKVGSWVEKGISKLLDD